MTINSCIQIVIMIFDSTNKQRRSVFVCFNFSPSKIISITFRASSKIFNIVLDIIKSIPNIETMCSSWQLCIILNTTIRCKCTGHYSSTFRTLDSRRAARLCSRCPIQILEKYYQVGHYYHLYKILTQICATPPSTNSSIPLM
jgi:hypothetical protein